MQNKSIYTPVKPSVVRKIGAYLLDAIIFLVLVTGFAYLLSFILQYDKTNNICNGYFLQYGIKIKDNEGNIISQSDPRLYQEAWNNFYMNSEASNAWALVIKKTIIMILVSVFLSTLIIELIVPIVLKQGRSLGRYILKIALINKEGIKVHFKDLFIRFLFGKIIVNMFVPITCLLLIYLGYNNMYLWLILLIVVLANIYCVLGTKLHQTLPDYIGMCYKCNYDEQVFFDTIEELNAAKGKEEIIKNKKERNY